MHDELVATATLAPWDAHNRRLVADVHPSDWRNPTPSGRYNLVVIGGGTAGPVTAAGAAGLGAKVALVEKHLLGGDGLNYGCVPSKALIRAGRAASDVAHAREFGVRVPAGVDVDFPAIMERMRRLRANSLWDRLFRSFRLREDAHTIHLGLAEFDDRQWQTLRGMVKTPAARSKRDEISQEQWSA